LGPIEEVFSQSLLPNYKVHGKRKEIYIFQQEDGETLYDTHEIYKPLLKRCSGHNFSMMEITSTFKIGLNMQTCIHLYSTVEGTMKNKIAAKIRKNVLKSVLLPKQE
jgi:hypothetical protein